MGFSCVRKMESQQKAASAGELFRELDDYLKVNALNEMFTDLIAKTLEEKPENAILFVMQTLAKNFPDRVPARGE